MIICIPLAAHFVKSDHDLCELCSCHFASWNYSAKMHLYFCSKALDYSLRHAGGHTNGMHITKQKFIPLMVF